MGGTPESGYWQGREEYSVGLTVSKAIQRPNGSELGVKYRLPKSGLFLLLLASENDYLFG